MKLYELARSIGAEVLTRPRSLNVDIDKYYIDDRISELLAKECCDTTLVVSNILNPHIFRVAGLLDVPAICLLNNYVPEQEMLDAALENGTILMVSSAELQETAERLCLCLGAEARVTHANRT